jgi:[acyl-carrier-protein] S-malonyltransferase
MTGRLLLLCPGQGGQHAGMFDLARTHAGARDFLDHCAVPADGAALFDNRVAQPAIVAATLAMWLALNDTLRRCCTPPPAPAPLEDIVRLAAARATLMDAAATGEPQGLAAISGVAVDTVRKQVDVAIVTGIDTCIAGGTRVHLDALPALWPAARIQLLPVGIASHTPRMQEAVAPFARLLEGRVGRPRCPVLAGIDATRVTRPDVAIDRLSRQLAETIDWAACMDAVAESGTTVALELGPGAALARMLQARHPHIACRSVADFHTLDGVSAWVARALA